MTDDRIGHLVSEDLLAALNRVFPQTLPGINDTERRIFITVGHREVIDFLTRQHDEAASQSLEA